ncbi:GTP-binding protein [Paludicola sp. MB14-C6]|uniref:CobW family GTP-binding protein n=1 Tax=Paludihabitans sp. MB14-C6 TaxID=3070656 RepID=UPI0027DC4408|nr:GTP-binding protein [Paludicola sp. MB14-C6]WMJ22228.1 GTP-binding protein [Paludicola sp. MB14-C6]
MTGIYLITGFLGAGKTTFLKKFVRMQSAHKMRVIVNEFGKEGVDGQLLKELPIVIDEINNGSIFCSCRLEQFETVLVHALKEKPELIIIEASGLSDPTNIRKILSQKDKYNDVKLLGSICIVDAINFKKVISTARVCKKQLSVSDLVIINKSDIATPEDIELTNKLIHDLYPHIITHLTSFGEIKEEWLSDIDTQNQESHPLFQTKDLGLQKALIQISNNMGIYKLKKFLEMICEDTYRIKGFLKFDETIYLVDCVGSLINVEEYTLPLDNSIKLNYIVTLAGPSMNMRKSLENAQKWYKEDIIDIQ